MSKTILVTGATGTVGAYVLKALAGRSDVHVRAGVRSAKGGEAMRGMGVETVAFDFEKSDSMAQAARGVDTLFLLAPEMRDQVGASSRLVELAKAAGVARIVKLSALDCDREPTIAFGRAHRDVERVIEASGLSWTFLRPNNFMEDCIPARHGTFVADANGDIRVPFGEGACSFVAAADIGDVAATVLTNEGHDRRIYDLTGPEALRISDIARAVADATGRPVRYVDARPEEVQQRWTEAHVPPPVIAAVLELYALGREGRAAAVHPAVFEVTGRPARTFRDFARGHAADFFRSVH